MGPALAVFAVFLFVFTIRGEILDISRPTEGYNLCDPTQDCELIMPLTIAQCEPVLIYYNMPFSSVYFNLSAPDSGDAFLSLYTTLGIGYMEWICDIPARSTFFIDSFGYIQSYTV